jgi:hypothetical protein
MDATVAAALAKWPNVPDVHGWLRLDERGSYRLRAGDASARHEPIGNAALAAFIGSNYAADEAGRWFFQNGPQRVFVELAVTPWIYRLDHDLRIRTHTGQDAGAIDAVLIDDRATPIIVTALGPGVVDDRDLAHLLPHLCGEDGTTPSADGLEAWLEAPVDGRIWLRHAGTRLPVTTIARLDLATRFGFVANPA